MKYAVIGGAGFIGHNIVMELLRMGGEVIVIDNLLTGKYGNIPKNVVWFNADISTIDVDVLANYLDGVDVVFHTAAKARVQPSIADPITFNKVNVEGTLRVLSASNKAKVRRVVYSASSSAYGNPKTTPTPETAEINPMSPYGLQKLVGEQYCQLFSEIYGLDTVNLRYFNVYGEGMPLNGAYRTILSIFGEQYKNGKPFTITNDGEQKRDFTYVGDVVNANILAAKHINKLNGEVFNVGNGLSYSINDVVKMFGDIKTEFIGNVIEPKITLADNTKIKSVLGWEPNGDLREWIKGYKLELKA
jgi:UDP-glucose 4-epimerase